jgi:hypothetical protein
MTTFTLVNTTEGERDSKPARVGTLKEARVRLIRWLASSKYDSDGQGAVEVTGDVVDETGAVVASVVGKFIDSSNSDKPMRWAGWRDA